MYSKKSDLVKYKCSEYLTLIKEDVSKFLFCSNGEWAREQEHKIRKQK